MVLFSLEGSRLVCRYEHEILWLEGWGKNSLRVRGTKQARMPAEDYALDQFPPSCPAAPELLPNGGARITNGNITATLDSYGRITYTNQTGRVLLKEYWRHRVDLPPDDHDDGHGGTTVVPGVGCALQVAGREYRPITLGGHQLTMRFESEPNEKIYGMGQYQQPYLNLKNTVLELAQRNSQASVPFALSSLGYGFLWNVPAVGQVEFCKNITVWKAECASKLDYWITAGDNPAEIVQTYASVCGTAPMMPEWAMGFWQSKLRYQTQEEVLEVAREYRKRGIPLSAIVIDFFHWPLQGEWKFDPTYWPDPDAMIAELKEMGIEPVVSVWPTVDYRSAHYKEMKAKGYLLRSDRGFPISMQFMGNTVHFDATNSGARQFVWGKIKQNYYDKGIHAFWLDEAEPEFSEYDFDLYRNHLGPHAETGNIYPLLYAKTFFNGMREAGQNNVLNLVRCAWAGSQRYGALVWSGDIYSTFESMRCQVAAGLNMGLAGIPWWTTDIGGFFGGSAEDPAFRELLVRWFQFGTFCPVMRLHGDRLPKQPQVGSTGGAACRSGAPNEVWSFGEEVCEICCKYLEIRERLKPYISRLMEEAHMVGSPVMRTLFYEFPEDDRAWLEEDTYLFGPDLLVAPVLESGAVTRRIYLPAGTGWRNVWTGEVLQGGQELVVDAPLEQIPIFVRDGADIPI